ESQAQIDLEHTDKVLSMQDDEVEPTELQEVVEIVTTAKLKTEVVTAASAAITAATLITTAPSATRRRKEVVIRDPEEAATQSIIIQLEPKSKDKGKGIMVEDPKPLKKKEKEDNAVMRYQALKRKPQIKVQARKNMMIYLRNMAGFKMNYSKGMSYDDIQNNKPYFKIIRADDTHQLFLSFLSLLRNFDREDLEVLWQIVKERFASSKPKNFSDDFLLMTLTYMFEKPNVEDQV
nr:hypothetical protein [Tanacetum cinerariifolium]